MFFNLVITIIAIVILIAFLAYLVQRIFGKKGKSIDWDWLEDVDFHKWDD